MRHFSYRAVNNKGVLVNGSITADTAAEAESLLSGRGLQLVACHSAWWKPAGEKQVLTRKQLIDFTFHLHQMAMAGVPILESLSEYRNGSAKVQVRALIDDLIDQIESGSSLSDACSSKPAVFNNLYISLLSAGEQSGRLEEVLSELLDLLKWQDETFARIKSVMLYPIFVFFVLIAVLAFVMTWLVPSLLDFIVSTGGTLPWHTLALVAVSNFLTDYGLQMLFTLLFLGMGLTVLVKINSSVRMYWHITQLRLPVIGDVIFKLKLARYCRCAAMMYASGINLIDTLRHGEGLLDNMALAQSLQTARQKILAGESVSDAIGSQKFMPALFVRLLRVGEKTGAMDDAFLQLSYFYDRDSRDAIANFEQCIGPVLMVIVGGIMSWVVFSVIGPIYDLVFSMQGSF